MPNHYLEWQLRTKEIQQKFQYYRKFRAICMNINSVYWNLELAEELVQTLCPLIEKGDYKQFLIKYHELDLRRLRR